MNPRAVVTGPLAAPPRVGLAVSAITVTERENRWENGFGYLRECPGPIGTGDGCNPEDKDIDALEEPQTIFQPYYVWAGEKCTAMDRETDWAARVRRRLEADQWAQIASELWRGDQAQAAGFEDNRYLNDAVASDVLTDGPTGMTDALACLEQGLAHYLKGRQGMIHALPHVVTYWHQGGALTREGNLLRTILGTIVVPDAGYDGSGPGGIAAAEGSVWAYGTDVVYVRLGQVTVLGADGNDQDGYEVATNTREVRAERYAAATWDGCAHVAVEIDANLCDIGGAGS